MLNNIRNLAEFNSYSELTTHIKQIPIELVVEHLGVQLQQTGSSLQGQCPTGHPSKNGKCFSINTIGNFFKCFSCNISGSNIDLVMEVKKFNFIESVEWLCSEFDIKHSIKINNSTKELSEEDKKELDRVNTNAILYEKANEWMHELLFEEEGKVALEYLINERKYDIESLKKSEFCYFPKAENIIAYLKEQFPESVESINALPLTGSTGDNFRLAFPYRNVEGKITGFIKRATEPKGIAVNGKENVRWDATKGVNKKDLFNLFKTKTESTLLVVEGYPDAIYFSAMGMKNIVAVGQGNLSREHLKGLQTTAVKNIIISFDNDEVGPKNTRKAVELCLDANVVNVYVIDPQNLGTHKDPDEYVKANGLKAFEQLLNKSESGLIWLSKQIIAEANIANPLSKQKTLDKLIEYLVHSNNELENAELANIICKELKVEKAVVNKLVKNRKDAIKLETYKKLKQSDEINRYLPFIEKGTNSYAYYDGQEDEVSLGVSKDILENILVSAGSVLPEVLPVLKADFDVMMNERYDLEKEVFNFFVPTEYMLLEKNDVEINSSEKFPNIERLLVNLIPKSSERLRFINWLAGILQTRQKQQTAWVLKGEQGAGKGLMLDHVLKPLFGYKQAIQVEDAQLKAQFNPWLQNVILIAFNEVAHDNPTRNGINSKIKAIITDSEVIINEKNIRNYTVTNYANCIFFSNEKIPVLIEKGDRRFNIVETGGKLRDKEWFSVNPDNFIENLEKEVPYFAQFLMNWDYDKIAAMTCIENEEKKVLVGAALNKFEEFALHLKNNDVEWFEENASPLLKSHYEELNGKIKKSSALKLFMDIYANYKIADSELGKKLKLYGISGDRDRKGGVNVQYYVWGGK